MALFSVGVYAAGTTAYQQACTFPAINSNNWITINVFLVLAAVVIASLVYTLAGFLPTISREKLKGAAKTEATQAFLSIFIIMAVTAFAAVTCNVGIFLTKSATATTGVVYSDPMQYAQTYISNLLYERSSQLFGQMYAESALFLLWGNIDEQLASAFEVPISLTSDLQLNTNLVGVYYGYSGVLTSTYTGLIVITFAVLFVMWILLPVIQSFALTAMLPTALIIRTLPFGGPRLREAADSILAIAIAFFFILPLAISMNSFIISWMFCSGNPWAGTGPVTTVGACNPYASFVYPDLLNNLQTNSYFSGVPTNVVTVPQNSALPNGGQNYLNPGLQLPFSPLGVSSGTGGLSQFLVTGVQTLYSMPYVIDGFGVKIAEYMFESIVLIALDLAITIGFAQGLTKGLGSISTLIGTGPFWGNI